MSQRIVPPARDNLEPAPPFGEPSRIERPDTFAPVTTAVDESGGRKHLEVLRDALPCHAWEPLSQRRDRCRTIVGQAVQKRQPRLVAERREEQRGARHTSF